MKKSKLKKEIIEEIHILRRKVGWGAFADYWNKQRMMRFSKKELLEILERETSISEGG